MSKSAALPEQDEHIWQQAADWVLRLQENPHCPELQRAYQAWLAQNPDHARIYEQTRSLWQLSAQLSPIALAPASPVRKKTAIKCLFAMAACLLLISLPWLHKPVDYQTGATEHQQITLADGSQLELASQTALDLHFDHRQRQLTLHHGRLFIDVAHEPTRPFSIHAGSNLIQVIGTAFEVAHATDETRISVERGQVQVRLSADTTPIDLEAQDVLSISTTAPAQLIRQSSSYIAPWRQWQLLVDDQPLDRIIEQLEPYYAGWILLQDPTLGQRRLTASVNLKEPTQALETLLEPLGGQLTQLGPVLWIHAAAEPAAK